MAANKATKEVPYIAPELIERLLEAFPNTLPDYLLTETELAKLIGQQDVIRWLKAKLNIQGQASKGPLSVRATKE